MAVEHEDLTPRELAVKNTDEKQCFVSESSVYRILSAEDLITAPAHVVIRAADEFQDKITRLNELWQTDFTDLKVIGHAGGVPTARRLVPLPNSQSAPNNSDDGKDLPPDIVVQPFQDNTQTE
jgi:hypothetical protein